MNDASLAIKYFFKANPLEKSDLESDILIFFGAYTSCTYLLSALWDYYVLYWFCRLARMSQRIYTGAQMTTQAKDSLNPPSHNLLKI